VALAASKSSFWITAGIVAILIALAVFIWWRFFQTYHLDTVHEGILYRDGNRGMREFATMIRKIKPRTVVCLVDERELADPQKPMFAQEMIFLKEQGIACEQIHVKLGGWPDTAHIRRFLDIVSKKENQPVVVHCAQGVRRTGMFVAAYQQSVLGWDDAKTKAEMKTFGHSQRTVKDVERFIDIYDEKSREVTAELPMSKE
jgi:protein tyrosine phosphatase (PTP) superfamily phosphohydrolase (DUF442 family)